MERVRKQRSFTTELMLWMLLLVVLPLLVLMAYFYIHTFSGLKQIEEEKSLLVSRAAQKSIANLGETILGVTITNGYWEDNRQAVLKGNMDWLQKNISNLPGIVPNVDFVAETDLQGRVLVQAGDIKELQGSIHYPIIMERFKKEPKFTGLLNTSKGIAVVAVSQVTGDNGEGNQVGLIITGRLLTNQIIKDIKSTLQTDIALQMKSGQFLSTSNEFTSGQIKPYLEDITANSSTEHFIMERHKQMFVAKVAAPFRDMAGNVIGLLFTQIPSVSTTSAADGLGTMGLYSLLIMILLLALVIYLLRLRIIVPLRHFTSTLTEIAAGRMVEEMPIHVLQAEAEIVGAIQQIMQWNQVLERTVRQRTAALRNLLDNARQGFLTVGPSLTVGEEFSVECSRIFGKDIAGLKLSQLLYSDHEEERDLLDSILSQYFEENDELKKELFFSLLPEESKVGKLTVGAEYKPILTVMEGKGNETSGSIMIVLTDLTETRRMEDLMHQERLTLRMVVQVVTHQEDYLDIAAEFDHLHQIEIKEIMENGEQPNLKAIKLYKAVHTLKGSFGFLQFIHVVHKLHELESSLEDLLNRSGELTADELNRFLQGQKLDTWLEEDLALLREALGESFELLKRDERIHLSVEQWRELEFRLESILVSEADKAWLSKLKVWRYKPLKSLLKHYPSYLAGLAARNGLLLHHITLAGGNSLVDTERYAGFARSLIHVVRNIVAHGIETPEERLAQGKDEYGTVRFSSERGNKVITITISDDGRGIDISGLREKAEREGLLSNYKQDELTDEELLRLIFKEQFSTALEVSEISGRGVGLSAVKAELDLLGGTYEVTTAIGIGTTFQFILPFDGVEGKELDGNS